MDQALSFFIFRNLSRFDNSARGGQTQISNRHIDIKTIPLLPMEKIMLASWL